MKERKRKIHGVRFCCLLCMSPVFLFPFIERVFSSCHILSVLGSNCYISPQYCLHCLLHRTRFSEPVMIIVEPRESLFTVLIIVSPVPSKSSLVNRLHKTEVMEEEMRERQPENEPEVVQTPVNSLQLFWWIIPVWAIERQEEGIVQIPLFSNDVFIQEKKWEEKARKERDGSRSLHIVFERDPFPLISLKAHILLSCHRWVYKSVVRGRQDKMYETTKILSTSIDKTVSSSLFEWT